MSLAKSAIRGGLWMAGIRYVSFVLNFLGNILLARLLVPEDFGVFALAMSISKILFMLGGFGLAMACIHLQEEAHVFDTGLIFSWGLALGLSLLGVATAWIIQSVYADDVAIFLAILCIMNSLQMPASIYLAYLEKNFSFRRSALISSIGRSSAFVFAIILAILEFGKWSLLSREVIAFGLVFLGALIFSPYRFGYTFDKDTAIKIWRFSFSMFFMRMSEVLFQRVPNFIVGSLAGTATLGLFERSWYVSNLPNTMLTQFYGKVGFAVFSRVKNQPDKIAYGLEWNLFFASRFMFLAGVLVFLFPEFILTTLLGQQWFEAAQFFQGFALFIVTLPMFAAIKHALMATGIVTPVTVSRIIGVLIVSVGIVVAWFLDGLWIIVPWLMSLGAFLGLMVLAYVSHRHNIKIGYWKILKLPLLLAISILVIHGFMQLHVLYSFSTYILIWFLVLIMLEYNKYIQFYELFR